MTAYDPPRLPRIAGAATWVIVESSRSITAATTAALKASQRRAPDGRADEVIPASSFDRNEMFCSIRIAAPEPERNTLFRKESLLTPAICPPEHRWQNGT